MKMNKIITLRLIIFIFLSLIFITFKAYLELGVALISILSFCYFSRQRSK